MLKVATSIQTATGDYGSLRSEVTQNGDIKTIAIGKKQGGMLNGGSFVPKYHFVDVGEAQDLVDALTEAIQFLNGGKA